MPKTCLIPVFLLVFYAPVALCQFNLVPNPSFEDLSAKPKKIGELDKASPWISPTSGTAELFWPGAKADEIKSPANTIGFQQPHSGDNYAGAIFYDKKTPNLREYLQVELTSELVAGKVYCLEFYVSIADLSKYSIENIGGHFSKKSIGSVTMEPLKASPQVQNKPGRLLNDQVNWQIICGEFVAKGGEKFLTIGNFATDKQTQVGKMKKPRDFKVPQNEYGYYYIDDVSVIEQDLNYKCDCYKKQQGLGAKDMQTIYSRVTTESEELLNPENLIESKVVRFEEGQATFPSTAIKDLDLIVKIMAENMAFTVNVIGFAEAAELKENPSLNEQRAESIKSYLEKQGVRKNRIKTQTGKASRIIAGKEAEKGVFRKVEFLVDTNE